MSLTPGFKKFIGLIVVVAVVGGAIFAQQQGMFKSGKKAEAEQVYVQEESVQEPRKQLQAREEVSEPAPRERYREEAQTEHANRGGEYSVQPSQDPSANRGLNALLNSKK